MNNESQPSEGYIASVRISTLMQRQASLDDQLRVIHRRGDQDGMHCVDVVREEGKSGSIPGARNLWEYLIDRKRTRNDFTYLIVYSYSRFTRGGNLESREILASLNEVGIKVISATEPLPPGPEGELLFSVYGYANTVQVRSFMRDAVRTVSFALLDGTASAVRRVPYAVDLKVMAADGTALYILRLLTDQTRVLLDAETGIPIRNLGVDPNTKRPIPYTRQPGEVHVPVPGNPLHVRTVNSIFRMHLIDGLGSIMIARALNEDGVVTPTGKEWSSSTVLSILHNPIYLGKARYNARTSAVYCMRSDAGFEDVDDETKQRRRITPRRDGERRRKAAMELRESKEWRYQPQPQLAEFLDADLRHLAETMQQNREARYKDGRQLNRGNREGSGERFSDNFPLNGLIESKQYGDKLVGVMAGNTSDYAYYRSDKGRSVKTPGRQLRKMFPAGKLNRAVAQAGYLLLAATPGLREMIAKQVTEFFKSQVIIADHLRQLVAERESVQREYSIAVLHHDHEAPGLTGRLIAELKSKANALDAEIDKLQKVQPISRDGIADGVDKVMRTITTMQADLLLDTTPAPALREYFETIIVGGTADHETGEIIVEIGIPVGVRMGALTMCKPSTSSPKDDRFTHDETVILLGSVRLTLDGKAIKYRVVVRPLPQSFGQTSTARPADGAAVVESVIRTPGIGLTATGDGFDPVISCA